jgi:type IV pilus assembly protein PilB
MAQIENKTSLSSEEKRSLVESARLCEMIVEANPSDTGALETLREIYTKLGDRENLARVAARLSGTVGGRPSASVTPVPAPAPAAAPAPAPAEEMETLAASIDSASIRGPGKKGATATTERRPGSLSRLGDRLVAEKLISSDQLQRALAEQKGSADKLGTILVRLGFITEDSLVSFLSKQYAIPAITVAQVDPDPDVLKLVPEQIAKKHGVLPIKRMGNTLTLAMADPTNVFALDDVGFMTGLQIQPVVASEAAIRKAFERLYDTGASVTDMMSELEEADTDVEVVEGGEETFSKADIFDLKESADEAPVVRLINMILTDAIRRGASDIHLEPYEKVFRVRFRIDGVLHEIMTPPKRLEAALTSRVKIMATLDIAERRLPQDGRIKLRYHQREIDFRVSTLPTIFGEKTVMRILDKEALQLDLSALGFDPWSLEQFTKSIHNPYGMILITGPTGSGKTTTLYSAIHTINSPDINIMTAEDPVEYNLRASTRFRSTTRSGVPSRRACAAFFGRIPT